MCGVSCGKTSKPIVPPGFLCIVCHGFELARFVCSDVIIDIFLFPL